MVCVCLCACMSTAASIRGSLAVELVSRLQGVCVLREEMLLEASQSCVTVGRRFCCFGESVSTQFVLEQSFD